MSEIDKKLLFDNNDEIEAIAKKFNLKLLILFGSYAKGLNYENSDIDLAFESYEALSYDEEMKLLLNLSLYFRTEKVDLVNIKKADPLLLYQIAKYGKLLYGLSEDFVEFKCYASFRYADTQFLREQRRQYLRKEIDKLLRG
ncbi:nucleotidyltransferase domain-containing protein [Thermoanaerobacterium thermosaccharolyticum]|uniref:type VII toxin-antitoxin system MntA family adenylyltransferase antitoxin n=1 Tax=Thermoanaerobacterium thermosaccharolyticum TaxID=1517 RepID=UPI003D29124E